MLGDKRIGGAALLEYCLHRAHLVRAHQPRVVGYIRCKDCGETEGGRGRGLDCPLGSKIDGLATFRRKNTGCKPLI
jgi:hypothetical protein